MNVQVIAHEGKAQYAVLPWAEYQQLLKKAGGDKPAAQESPTLANLRELKSLREQAGLTLEAVARDAGISAHNLQMIESGEREVSDVIQRTLARALGVSGWQNE